MSRPPPPFLAGIGGGSKPGAGIRPQMRKMDLGEVLQRKQGLRSGGMDRTHTGGITRDASGTAIKTGFTIFTPEHDRIMQIYEAHGVDWVAMAAALPEYNLSVGVLARLAPKTAKAFAWNVTEGKYFDEAAGGGAAAPVQLAKDMENKGASTDALSVAHGMAERADRDGKGEDAEEESEGFFTSTGVESTTGSTVGDAHNGEEGSPAVVSDAEATAVVLEQWGLEVTSIKGLPSYDDLNFRVYARSPALPSALPSASPALPSTPAPSEYVLKMMAGTDAAALEALDFENAAMDHLAAAGVNVPRVLRAVPGGERTRTLVVGGAPRAVRLLTYVPGKLLADFVPLPRGRLAELGRFLGSVDRKMVGFAHPAGGRDHRWNLCAAPRARPYLADISADLCEGADRGLVERTLDEFEAAVVPALAALPPVCRQIVHNDANDHNVIVDDTEAEAGAREGSGKASEGRAGESAGGKVSGEGGDGENAGGKAGGEGSGEEESLGSSGGSGGSGAWRLGLIDFGDMIETYCVNNLAIGLAYACMEQDDPLEACATLVAAYHEEHRLLPGELDVLSVLVKVRLAQSVLMSAHAVTEQPDNREYLLVHARPAWALLHKFDAVPTLAAGDQLRAACGYEARGEEAEKERREAVAWNDLQGRPTGQVQVAGAHGAAVAKDTRGAHGVESGAGERGAGERGAGGGGRGEAGGGGRGEAGGGGRGEAGGICDNESKILEANESNELNESPLKPPPPGTRRRNLSLSSFKHRENVGRRKLWVTPDTLHLIGIDGDDHNHGAHGGYPQGDRKVPSTLTVTPKGGAKQVVDVDHSEMAEDGSVCFYFDRKLDREAFLEWVKTEKHTNMAQHATATGADRCEYVDKKERETR